MAKYKYRVAYKCFDSLVANKTESLRNKELQSIQEREAKLKELHEQMLQHAAAPVSPASSATTLAVGPQIIIVPDPDLLKQNIFLFFYHNSKGDPWILSSHNKA